VSTVLIDETDVIVQIAEASLRDARYAESQLMRLEAPSPGKDAEPAMPPQWYDQLSQWITDWATPQSRADYVQRCIAVAASAPDTTRWRRAKLGVITAIMQSWRENAPEVCDPVLALLAKGVAAGDPRWSDAALLALHDDKNSAWVPARARAAARAAVRAARASTSAEDVWDVACDANEAKAWAPSESVPTLVASIVAALEKAVEP